MRVLVLGGEGMLGHKVFEVLSRRFAIHRPRFPRPPGWVSWREFPQYAGLPETRLLGGLRRRPALRHRRGRLRAGASRRCRQLHRPSSSSSRRRPEPDPDNHAELAAAAPPSGGALR